MSTKVNSVNNISIESTPDALRNKRFSCGDLIVKASPFVHIISAKQNGNYCDWCALPATTGRLLKCAACQYEHYCNKQCQKASWKYHKFECPLIKAKLPAVAADSVRLFGKVVWNLVHGIDCSEVDPGWRVWTDLCDHSALLRDDATRMQSYSSIVYTLARYFGHDMVTGIKDSLSHFGRMVFNSFTLTHMGEEVGAAMYLSTSVFNHSCLPNAAHTCDGTMMYVRALKDIDTSQEPIFVNYIDPMQSKMSRQKELLTSYYFHCHCAKCSETEHEALLESTICPKCKGDVIKQSDDILMCTCCLEVIEDTDYAESCERAVIKSAQLVEQALRKADMDMGKLQEFLESNILLSANNVNLTLVKCTLYALISQTGDEAKAHELGEEIAKLLKLYYPDIYPAHSLHQFKQARLAWNVQSYGKAMMHYQCALRNLLLTHGPEHHLTKMAKTDIIECEQEKQMFEKFHLVKAT